VKQFFPALMSFMLVIGTGFMSTVQANNYADGYYTNNNPYAGPSWSMPRYPRGYAPSFSQSRSPWPSYPPSPEQAPEKIHEPTYRTTPESDYESEYKNQKASSNGGKVMLLSAGHANPAKVKLLEKLASEQGLELKHLKLNSLDADARLSDVVSGFDAVLLDAINTSQTREKFAPIQNQIGDLRSAVKVTALLWPEGEVLRRGVTENQAKRIGQYYVNGGKKNFTRLLTYIRGNLLDDASAGVAEAAIIVPEMGVYHPDAEQLFTTPDQYLDWYRGQYGVSASAPVVGINIHADNLASENIITSDAFIKQVAASGAVPMAFFYRSGRKTEELADWLIVDGKPVIHSLINTRVIHWAEEQKKVFEQLNVTVLNAINYSKEEQKWRDDNGGVPAMSVPFYLTMPEMAGVIDPRVIAARDAQDGRYYPIDEQIDLVVKKSVRLASLATKPNSNKKVAIMYYNYPPGEKNAGASFLNVPRSIEKISALMQEKGYFNETISEQAMIDAVANLQRPYYREEAPATVVEKGIAATLPITRYHRWYATLPESVRKEIEQAWGQPEDHYMVTQINDELQFVIPMMRSGNLMVLPQPPRGDKGNREKAIYHSKSVPINHYYLAVYLYLRENFKADALVHLGTHGSQEWLPGKERGLWAYDPGSLATADVPVIYPYIVDDVGEAVQAKRRGQAVMVSHMTPPLAPSGLYRELSEVHEFIHHYNEVDEGQVKQRIRVQLNETLKKMKIPEDMGWSMADADARFDEFLVALHDYLHDLALENQPLGMHTFGQLSEDRLITATIMQILGDSYVRELALYAGEDDSTVHTSTAAEGHDHDHDAHTESLLGDNVRLEDIPGYSLLHNTLMNGESIPADAPEALRAELERASGLLVSIRQIMEMDSFFKALDGKYVIPSTGGDPVRNDQSLPTGRNLYGFDPSRLPTKAAFETGAQLVRDLVKDYAAKHGKYPDKMAYSLWSIEAMRHHGVLEAQALYALGLRPVWDESGTVKGTEIIPYSELKRPRIDVVLSATGLYRDAFPGVMKLLAEGIEKIARLREDNNFVYQNAQRLQQQLLAGGMDESEAFYLSSVRIFSNSTGAYGTGLTEATLASDTWEKDDKLSSLYLSRMGHAYGSDMSRWGEKLEQFDLYRQNLSGTDMALFSRTSNVYGLLTSDDPFNFLGGLSLAVRNIDGKSPEMFISNLRNPKQEKMETVNSFMSKELRARYFHPRWIEEMQKEGYSGTLNILDTVNNFWGWQVVDPQNIRADQWQEFFEVYVNDKYEMDMKDWFEEHNAEVLAQISERMLEAVRKGYWQPDQKTLEKLVETYQEVSATYDVQTENQKLKDFVAEQANGFGLSIPNVTPVEVPPVNIPQPSDLPLQKVEGQQLEKVEQQQEVFDDNTRQILLLALLIVLLAGAFWQQWQREVMQQFKRLVSYLH